MFDDAPQHAPTLFQNNVVGSIITKTMYRLFKTAANTINKAANVSDLVSLLIGYFQNTNPPIKTKINPQII